MDLDAAHELLGVDSETSPRDVRRAYLRRVKEFPPEKDPEGFQRLRAAFELAHEVAKARRDVPAPHDVFGLENAALEADLPQFERAPELDPLPALPEVERVDALLADDLRDEARDLIGAFLRAIRSSRFDGEPEIDERLWNLALRLTARGATPWATTVLDRLEERLIDASFAGDHTRVLFVVLARELVDLPSRFPPSLRAEMAEALRQHDLDGISDVVDAYASEFPGRAYEASLMIRPLPSLGPMFADALGGPEVHRSTSSLGGCFPWLMFIIIVTNVLRCAGSAPG